MKECVSMFERKHHLLQFGDLEREREHREANEGTTKFLNGFNTYLIMGRMIRGPQT